MPAGTPFPSQVIMAWNLSARRLTAQPVCDTKKITRDGGRTTARANPAHLGSGPWVMN